MTLPEKHFKETKEIIKKVGADEVANWFLNEGFFPEQYVLPPPFKVNKFILKKTPNYKVKNGKSRNTFNPATFDLLKIGYPKSEFTDKTFGIIAPEIYHDLVWHLHNKWDFVVSHLFHKDIKIYSYSFPLPISKKTTELTSLRIGRMIYEFVEMAENDLVAESHNYKYVVKCDIKNFYPSIYTHSICWALHGKIDARKDRFYFQEVGSILDKLLQQANDGCTNGLPIGPAISDIIAEILLAAVDKECSQKILSNEIKFLGVRYKDDYRFLCHTQVEGQKIIKLLQEALKEYNLVLNETKCEIKNLPEGLFRKWKIDYTPYSLRYKKNISYKKFENTLLRVLQIDNENKDTGIIDTFLSELSTKQYDLKIQLQNKKALKAFSLLLALKTKRTKSFPHILAIIEQLIIQNKLNVAVMDEIKRSIENLIENKFLDPTSNEFDLLWLSYFIKSTGITKFKWPLKIESPLLLSIKNNTQKFFPADLNFYSAIQKPKLNTPLLNYLTVFKK